MAENGRNQRISHPPARLTYDRLGHPSFQDFVAGIQGNSTLPGGTALDDRGTNLKSRRPKGSSSSRSSKAVSIKSKQLDIDRDKELHQLEDQLARKKMDVKILQGRIHTLDENLKILMENTNPSDEQKQQQTSMELDLLNKREQLNNLVAEVEFLESTAESQRAVIISQHALQKEMLESEEEDAASDEDPVDRSAIRNWLENVNRTPLTNTKCPELYSSDNERKASSQKRNENEENKVLGEQEFKGRGRLQWKTPPKLGNSNQPAAPAPNSTASYSGTDSTEHRHVIPRNEGSQGFQNKNLQSTPIVNRGQKQAPPRPSANKLKRINEVSNENATNQRGNFHNPRIQHPSNFQPQQFQTRPTTNQVYKVNPRQNDNVRKYHHAPQTEPSTSVDSNIVQQLTAALTSAFGSTGSSRRLPTFSGNPAQWNHFLSTFENTYQRFSDQDNLSRISEALQGDAKSSVEHLMANSNNLWKVIDVLQRRFGRPQQVLDHLIDKAKSSKNVEQSKPETLIQFGTTVDALLTNIHSFKLYNYVYDRYLLSELVKKLPAAMQSSWYEMEAGSSTEVTLNDFNNWIQPKVDGAALQVKPKMEDHPPRRPRAPGIHAAIEETKATCEYCEMDNHVLEKCFKFKKIQTRDRWNFVKDKKLCYNCLSSSHCKEDCSEPNCSMDGCDKKHHPLLHREKGNDRNSVRNLNKNNSVQTADMDSDEEDGEDSSTAADDETKQINVALNSSSLPVVQVKLTGPKGSKLVYAFLDSGSSFSMLDADVAQELGLEGPSRSLNFKVFGGSRSETSISASMKIQGVHKNAKTYKIPVSTVSKIGVKAGTLNMDQLKRDFSHMRGVKATSLINVTPQLLIGFNNYNLYYSQKVIEPPSDDGPYAYKSKLGWYVQQEGNEESCLLMNGILPHDQLLHEEVKKFFSLESFGVTVVPNSTRSKEDKRALELLEKNTIFQNGRWKTGLLWKNDQPHLPSSKAMASKRLKTMEKKMDRDPDFSRLVTDKFADYIKKGFLVKKEKGKVNQHPEKTWYLPWFFAYHPTKKPRLVFDAAAKSHGVSLNDFLLKGPDLLNPLPNVLMRFRKHKIPLTGDIKEMFHQVQLAEEDWQSQTILYRGTDRNVEPEEYYMTVLFFGAASSPCSAIFAKNKNADRFIGTFPEAVKIIHDDFYMDDLLSGAPTIEDAIRLQKEISHIHSQGGFQLTKWDSSEKSVLEAIPSELRSHGDSQFLEKGEIFLDKTLGLWWNPGQDHFTFKLNLHKVPKEVVSGERRPTKREMVSLVMSLFDPLGFIAPVKLKALILIQDIWRSGIDWDDEVPSSIDAKWRVWLEQLPNVESIVVPRKLSDLTLMENVKTTLHVFCDASEEAFSCAAYLVMQLGGSSSVAFIAGKARVAPLKGLTIPKMELQAALMGSRLATSVKTAYCELLPDMNIIFWSDSKCVLNQIRSSTLRFKTFESNRIGEILMNTDVTSWRWVPSKLNVADDATRSSCELNQTTRWLTGVGFLNENENEWPQEDKAATADSANTEEMGVKIICIATDEKRPQYAQNFSSWFRLVHSTAILRRSVRLRLKILPQHTTVEDIRWAERILMRLSQEESFQEEFAALKAKKPVSNLSRIYKLSPSLSEDGLIVLSGRINAAPGVNSNVKRPPILDANHPYTKLLIQWLHDSGAHQGQERVLNELRQRAWVLNARAAVRRCWAKCLTCNYRRVQPQVPLMGQLPASRLGESHFPFDSTGVDYFGPFLIKNKRSLEKRWGVIFTCLSTRAVHLELAESLNTSDMINALVRFMSIRGRPSKIFSDNGTNFVGANREIREALEDLKAGKLVENVAQKGIEWNFNPPTGSHFGGVFERLVGSVKRCLGFILKCQHPTDGVLRTIFAEVTEILNNRPLTYVSPDPADSECLTPNHFLRLRCGSAQSVPGIYDAEEYRRTWRWIQSVADSFWKRWTVEYLPTLAPRGKWYKEVRPLKVGDLVIVVDDQSPRSTWKKGIITATYAAGDKQVRAVEVKVASVKVEDKKKKVTYSFLRRPVAKLCPLGLSCIGAGAPGRENVAAENK